MGKLRSCLCGIPIVLAAWFTSPASANSPQKDLTEFTLEELMNIEVTTAGKIEQALFETPAAVYVITSEDIRRSGARNLPDLLRGVPGIHVAQVNSNRWAVTARGFNGGQAGNKLMVLVDGRSVYNNLFALIHWGTLDMMLEDIDRIEVIRGPGAVLWGSNAVNGVINIITKPPSQTLGGLVVAGAGNYERAFGDIRYGARIGDKAEYRVYSRYFQRNNFITTSGADASDAWHDKRSGFRLDWRPSARDSLQFQGSVYGGHLGESTTIFDPARPGYRSTLELPAARQGWSSSLEWLRASRNSQYTMRLQFERQRYDESRFGERRDNFNVQFEHNFKGAERHNLLWGVDYLHSPDHVRSSPILAFDPPKGRFDLARAFVQDDIRIGGRAQLIVGMKIEKSNVMAAELSPNVRFSLDFGGNHMIWAAVSHADRRSSRVERDLDAVLPGPPDAPLPAAIALVGNPGIESEELDAFETGLRAKWGRRTYIDIAAFHNRYRDLVTLEPLPPFLQVRGGVPNLVIPLRWTNNVAATSQGAEAAATFQVTGRWTIKATYSYFNPKTGGYEAQLLADPRHQFHVRTLVTAGRWEFDAAVSTVATLIGQPVPRYTRFDGRMAWHPSSKVSLELVGQNLFEPAHPEFVASFTRGVEVRRSMFGKLIWRF